MPRLPHHVAAERMRQAMYSVDVIVECPSCDEHIHCTVDGDDVTIAIGCINECDKRPSFRRQMVDDDALAKAGAERSDYERHLQEHDDR